MRIYSMTATFGKLENQTLTLEPGLNVLCAPNEWGKSTWCAFLAAMLYGIDTRERSTLTTIADKERYAPWSGSPMSGQMRLDWNGRDITIERRTKGRSIFGDFKAYETQSGLPVAELTAANCGQLLLGVEKSVFTRSCFIRQTDLPVTGDEALRRRLNALVTTGDESGASDDLAQKLRDLKNRCRHNKTGLLPQAEKERDTLTQKLDTLSALRQQIQALNAQLTELDVQLRELNDHQSALDYADAQEDMRRVEAANAACQEAERELAAQSAQCDLLPKKAEAAQALEQLEQLQLRMAALQSEAVPTQPEKPAAPAPFVGMEPQQAVQQASSDTAAFHMLSKPLSPVLPILAAVSLLAGIGLSFVRWVAAIPFWLLAVVLLLAYSRNKAAQKRDRQAVAARYGTLPPEQWLPTAQQYQQRMAQYAQSADAYKAAFDDLESRRCQLTQTLSQLTDGAPVQQSLAYWRRVISAHEALEKAQLKHQQAKEHADTLAAMVKQVQPPQFEDRLTLSREQTQQSLLEASAQHRQLHVRLGQCMGQMEALGQEETLRSQLAALNARIGKLEDTYTALTIAQDTLTAASDELQRRFAPKISQRAQDIFSRLTDGRYERLVLGQDLSLSAGARDEVGTHSALWRSEGTADQLYLALRLAVAEELTPDAPLVLDDAFVRFDSKRLASAMGILTEAAQQRQIILFSCQERERAYTSPDSSHTKI